jgi:hypothetical protein
MTDYYADPVWDVESVGMVDLDRLPVPDELRQRVRGWAREWDAWATEDDFGGGSDADGERLAAAGRMLWQELRTKLVGKAELGFFPDGTRHVQWEPDGRVEPCPPHASRD